MRLKSPRYPISAPTPTRFSRFSRLTRTARAAIFALGLCASGCRQDMHNQPKFIPLRSTEFFPDRRSAREPVPGTVARGELQEDVYFYTGKRGGVLGNELPFPAGQETLARVLERGQERFNIYCSPCHARLGDGNGMIVQRGFKRPPSFHEARLRNAPLGHFFSVISNGLGAMPDYAAQIQPADRWAIAAYIRALQLSQNASLDDVAPDDRGRLQATPQPPPQGGTRP